MAVFAGAWTMPCTQPTSESAAMRSKTMTCTARRRPHARGGSTMDSGESAAGFSTIRQESVTMATVSSVAMARGQGAADRKSFGARAVERIHNGQCHR